MSSVKDGVTDFYAGLFHSAGSTDTIQAGDPKLRN